MNGYEKFFYRVTIYLCTDINIDESLAENYEKATVSTRKKENLENRYENGHYPGVLDCRNNRMKRRKFPCRKV